MFLGIIILFVFFCGEKCIFFYKWILENGLYRRIIFGIRMIRLSVRFVVFWDRWGEVS